MEGSFNQTFFSFVLGLFGIILASFAVTVLLDRQLPLSEAGQASVIEALRADLTQSR